MYEYPKKFKKNINKGNTKNRKKNKMPTFNSNISIPKLIGLLKFILLHRPIYYLPNNPVWPL